MALWIQIDKIKILRLVFYLCADIIATKIILIVSSIELCSLEDFMLYGTFIWESLFFVLGWLRRLCYH